MIEYFSIMATQELGQPTPVETRPAENSGLLFSLASWYDRRMRSYIRPAEKPDYVKIARRNRTLRWGALGTEAAVLLGLGVMTAGPVISDTLRENGILDHTTPVRRDYNNPNLNIVTNLQGDRIVSLSTPYDVALGERSAVSSIVPGLDITFNIDLANRITSDPKYGIRV